MVTWVMKLVMKIQRNSKTSEISSLYQLGKTVSDWTLLHFKFLFFSEKIPKKNVQKSFENS